MFDSSTNTGQRKIVTNGQSTQPSFLGGLFFFLLFSGPPRFRERDPAASLHGDIDGVVILHLVVWVAAGLWALYQLRFYFKENSLPVGLRLPQRLGLGIVAALGLSTFVSVSPSLTAFKVCQMLILLLFTTVFVERYGVQACLRKIFQASVVLCLAIPVAAIVSPELVYVTTETGAQRLRGDYIAGTEVVSFFCLVLLIAGVQKIPKIVYGPLLVLSCGLLAVSLSRTAFLVLLVASILVLLRRPNSKPFRRFALVCVVAVSMFFVTDLVSDLDRYRDSRSIFTLSDRVGLWTYLSHVTLQTSPLLGLGYYAASRVYGPQYNSQLGAAHSMFVETFVGGGFLAFTLLMILCSLMCVYAVRVFRQGSVLSFTVTILFVATMMFGFIGPNLDSGSVATIFWSLAAIFPPLQSGSLVVVRGDIHATQWISSEPAYPQ
jgi:hypothetical protein